MASHLRAAFVNSAERLAGAGPLRGLPVGAEVLREASAAMDVWSLFAFTACARTSWGALDEEGQRRYIEAALGAECRDAFAYALRAARMSAPYQDDHDPASAQGMVVEHWGHILTVSLALAVLFARSPTPPPGATLRAWLPVALVESSAEYYAAVRAPSLEAELAAEVDLEPGGLPDDETAELLDASWRDAEPMVHGALRPAL